MKAIFAGLLLLGACHPPSYYQIHLDPNLTSDEITQVREAIADWEEHLPELHTERTSGACAGRYACITVSMTSNYVDGESGAAEDIVVSRLISRAEVARELRHKLGHAFGLGHYGPNTVMDPDPFTWTYTVMPRDVAMWHSIR